MDRGRVPRPGPGRPLSYTVTLEPNDRPWLFALELASSLPRPMDDADSHLRMGSELALMTQDRQLLTRGPVVQAVRYEQISVLRDSFPASENEREQNLRLPASDPRTHAFGRQLRSRVASDAAFASELLRWFHDEPFVYTLTPPLLESDPIDAFLFDTRRGFCEHYASAFVVLMRAAGIPARAVTGYQGGEINPNGGYMIVRQSDAHAWAEAMIGGQWIRYDPTAAVAPSRIESGLGAALPSNEPVPYLARVEFTWLKSMRLHWDAVNYQWQRGVVGFNTSRQREFLRDVGLDADRPWQAIAVIALGVLLWGVVILGLARARRAQEDPGSALWQKFCARLARAGMVRAPAEGPLAFAERAAVRWPRSAARFKGIADDYARLRYGRDDVNREPIVARLRQSLAGLPRARTLAAEKPSS
jgi:transglutaminase-like putative cysteine protease